MTYCVADSRMHGPEFFYEKLVNTESEFKTLKDGEPAVAFMLRGAPQFSGGRVVLGSVHMPAVTGRLSKLFDWLLEDKLGLTPDYLFILDFEFWKSADPRQREILMFHEMKHCDQAVDEFGAPRFTREGMPIWRLVAHDVKEFHAVVRRYGAYAADLKIFAAAMAEGESK